MEEAVALELVPVLAALLSPNVVEADVAVLLMVVAPSVADAVPILVVLS